MKWSKQITGSRNTWTRDGFCEAEWDNGYVLEQDIKFSLWERENQISSWVCFVFYLGAQELNLLSL